MKRTSESLKEIPPAVGLRKDLTNPAPEEGPARNSLHGSNLTFRLGYAEPEEADRSQERDAWHGRQERKSKFGRLVAGSEVLPSGGLSCAAPAAGLRCAVRLLSPRKCVPRMRRAVTRPFSMSWPTEHTSTVRGVAFEPDGNSLISVGYDATRKNGSRNSMMTFGPAS